jgi:Fe-S cluster assembly ATP-binding protein
MRAGRRTAGPSSSTPTGLDVDALRVVAQGINSLRGPERSMILVTHYERLLELVVPDFVHVLAGGRIIKSGDQSLARELDARGYDWVQREASAG